MIQRKCNVYSENVVSSTLRSPGFEYYGQKVNITYFSTDISIYEI